MASVGCIYRALTQAQMVLTIFVIYNMIAKSEVESFPKSNKNNKETRFRRTTDMKRETWPNATIPYVIDCSIVHVNEAKTIIRAAMAEWERRTCIRFVKRTNQSAYLLIRRFSGCWGEIGYRGRKVVISMGDGCEFKYVMMHELGHIIGFHHEHQRPDRDDFVDILWDNIINSMMKQFSKRTKSDILDGELPYDYSSIMHYRFGAFGKNRSLETIKIKENSTTKGHRPYSYITDMDVRKTAEMYNCSTGHLKKYVKNTIKPTLRKSPVKQEEKILPLHDPDATVNVSLTSPGWYGNSVNGRIASIMVNGKEMAQNGEGINIVVLNYLSGRATLSAVYLISTKRGGLSFSNFLKQIPQRNYFLIVSKAYSLHYIKEARNALREIGGKRVPLNMPPGSSLCFVGYKGNESVQVKFVTGGQQEKASFLSMNLSLAQEYRCQDDIPNCPSRRKKGDCRKRSLYTLKVCQKSCKTCEQGRPCKDEHNKCEKWAKRKYCYKLPSYMMRKCKVSCKICRKALPSATPLPTTSVPTTLPTTSPTTTTTTTTSQNVDTETTVRKHGDQEEEDEEDDRIATGVKCTDKSATCPAWAKFGRCVTDKWVKDKCLISCKKKGVCDLEPLKPEGSCCQPLGLGWNQTLPDSAFNASSFLTTGPWRASPSNARLYMEDDFESFRIGCWCAKNSSSSSKEWLLIDLGEVKNITAIATQGRFRYYEHVKSYLLSFSKDGKAWRYYIDPKKYAVKTFKGNCDHVTPVLNIFERNIIARFVKIHPRAYYAGMCMRLELYGCNLNHET